MRISAALCWMLLICVATLTAQKQPLPTSRSRTDKTVGEWIKLTPDQGSFSIQLPQTPKEKTETGSSDTVPPVTYTSHLLVAETVKGVFIVGWVDYDPSFSFGIQSELEANRNNFVKGIKGTLITTEKITIKGNPGLEFTAENPEITYRSRVYIIGRRPYQLIAGTYKGQENSTDVARFFASFELH